MKQTAVEWLVEEFKEKLTGNNLPNWVLDVIQQAKAMEKEQIKDAFVECWKENTPDGYECKLSAEEYCAKTYKQIEK